MDLKALAGEMQKTFLRASDSDPREEVSVSGEGIEATKRSLDFEYDDDEKIRVYLRLKSGGGSEEEEGSKIFARDNEVVCVAKSGGGYGQRFVFSRIFPSETDQSTFFREMVLPRLADFLRGLNQLIFTYGATSSGKTFTVQGTPSLPGILPRALDVIFNSLGPNGISEFCNVRPQGFNGVERVSDSEVLREEKELVLHLGRYLLDDVGEDGLTDVSAQSLASMFPSLKHRERENAKIDSQEYDGISCSVWVSFAEIYNENIYDLFEKIPVPGKNVDKPKRPPLKLAKDRKGSNFIKGLREVPVSTADEAYQLLLIGRENLQFAATKLNHNSSRSHCIFSIKIIKHCNVEQPNLARVSILSFCDLAGSERIKKTHNVGARQKEAGNINASLLVLGRVIKAMRDNQHSKDSKKYSVVPFRDSKLTRLFQAFFMGLGRTSMIVNISQASHLFDETVQVLKFAAITSKVCCVKEPTPLKPKRQSRFSSIMFEHRRRSGNSLSGRGSIVWENPTVRSTICQAQIDESDEYTTTTIEELDETRYEALTNLIDDLKQRLSEEKRKNLTMESEIRKELCDEFSVIMVKVEEGWQQRLQKTTDRLEGLSEWRLNKMESAYKESRGRKRRCVDDEELSDKIAVLETELEDRESQLTENNEQLKALKDTHRSMVEIRNKMQEELSCLKFEKEDQRVKIDKLQKDLNKLTLENQSKDSAIESFSADPIIADLNHQLKEFKEKVSTRDNEISDLKKLLDEAGEEFLAKDDQVMKMTAEIKSLKVECTRLNLALKDSQEESAVLISESNTRLEEREILEDQLVASKKEKNDLLAEKANLLLEITRLKEDKLTSAQKFERDVFLTDSKETEKVLNKRIQELEDENHALKEKSEFFKNETDLIIEDLRQTSKNEHENSKLLQKKNLGLKAKLTTLESELKSFKISEPKNNADDSVLQTKEFEKEEESCALKEELEYMKQKLMEKENILQNKQFEKVEELCALKEELECSKHKLKKKDNIIKTIEINVSKNEKIISEKSALLTEKEKELNNLKIVYDDSAPFREELKSKCSYINELEDIIVDKNYLITLTEEKLSSLENKDSERSEDITNLKEKLTSTSEEVENLIDKIDGLQKSLDEKEKLLKKISDDKNQKEKDLNDEIEGLRQSKVKIKSSYDDLNKQFSDKEKEISDLEREVKSLIQAGRTRKEGEESLKAELRSLHCQIKKLDEEKKDTEVLGKKIAEQQGVIEKLKLQLKPQQQEENVIEILKKELELKNTEKAQLSGKIAELEINTANLAKLSKLQEDVAYLEAELEAKAYEINKTKNERDDAMTRYSKLIKNKEEELAREKQEAIRLRAVLMKSTPNKQSDISLKEELEEKDSIIKKLEFKICKNEDGDNEDVKDALRDEVERLERELSKVNTSHSRELAKVKKASEKIIKEYKESNKVLQKQVGICTNRTTDESYQTSVFEADESVRTTDTSLNNQSRGNSVKKKRKGRNRNTRNNKASLSSTVSPGASLLDDSNLENEEDRSIDSCSKSTRKSTRVTRSRPVRKTKKNVLYQDSDLASVTMTSDPERSALKDVMNSGLIPEHLDIKATPQNRRSTRKPLYTPRHTEVFSPIVDDDESLDTPHNIVKRRLRTRKK